MKTLLAVPCMASVPTKFLRCLEGLQRVPDTYTVITENTLIHDARNEIASIAITRGFDRVMWLDSDMSFESDLMVRLMQDMDELDAEIVSAVYFQRVPPAKPVIYDEFCKISPSGEPLDSRSGRDDWLIRVNHYYDYPKNELFRIAACGFGAVLTTVSLLKTVWDAYGPPFSFLRNLGEDMSFCWRVQDLGIPVWCDSRIPVGHVGQYVYTQETFEAYWPVDPPDGRDIQEKSQSGQNA